MHSFVDLDRVLGVVPAPLVMTLRDIDRGQGSEGLYLHQVPDLLTPFGPPRPPRRRPPKPPRPPREPLRPLPAYIREAVRVWKPIYG